jgi:hypothetical protein
MSCVRTVQSCGMSIPSNTDVYRCAKPALRPEGLRVFDEETLTNSIPIGRRRLVGIFLRVRPPPPYRHVRPVTAESLHWPYKTA